LTAVALEADTVLVGMDRRRFAALAASGEAPGERLTGGVKR
jgi:hypothetical protein